MASVCFTPPGGGSTVCTNSSTGEWQQGNAIEGFAWVTAEAAGQEAQVNVADYQRSTDSASAEALYGLSYEAQLACQMGGAQVGTAVVLKLLEHLTR